MNLVIFTGEYPYGNSEVFLERELRVAEKKFNEIVIVSYAKDITKEKRYIPMNATVVTIRVGESVINQYMPVLFLLSKRSFWAEVVRGTKERGLKSFFHVVKKIALTEKRIATIKENEYLWSNTANTIFYSYWINPAALYLARKPKEWCDLRIARAHGVDCFYSRGYIPWRSFILEQMDLIIPISEMGKNDLLFHYEAMVEELRTKIIVSRLGVDVPIKQLEIQKKTDQFTIVSCSNVIQLKRLDLIIDALKHISDFSVHWVHYGDGPMLEKIKTQAKEKLDGSSMITYDFRGRVNVKEILSFYASGECDLFINCSDVEGIPVSVMEAMSYGIPAVIRDVGGNLELVNKSNGLIVSADSTPEKIAEAITIILLEKDEISYQERTNNARTQIAENFNAKKNYEQFYNMLIGKTDSSKDSSSC